MSTFSRLFGGHAPFTALQEHVRVVRECVVDLVPLFESLVAGDEAAMKAAAKRIFTAEQRADDLRDELRVHLPRSLFMPIDRRDLLELLRLQDQMGNLAEDIAGALLRRDMTPPEAMFDDVVALAREVVEVVHIAVELVELFDELVEVGFRGRMADKVEGIIARLDERETAADRLERALIEQLFTLEDEMSPVSVMLWYELLQRVGNVADFAEKVGDRMLVIIAR